MNDITKEFKEAVEQKYAERKASYKSFTHFASRDDLPGVLERSKKDIKKAWKKAGRDMSQVDFDVEFDVDLTL